MSLKEWKNTEINNKLMNKWGYSSKEEVLEEYGAYRDDDKEAYREEDDDLEEGVLDEPTEPVDEDDPTSTEAGAKEAPETKTSLTIDEARSVARKIFERINEARK